MPENLVMELKVWVEGIQRIVCGVTESTTCQDVVYALAHATGKTGRFTLIERWRNNERLLAPHEHPLKILMKWGEYSNDVQLILQRSGGSGGSQTSPQSPPLTQSPNDVPHGFSPMPSSDSPESRLSSCALPERNKDIRKSLTFSCSHHPQGLAEIRRANAKQENQQSPKAPASETGSLTDNTGSSPQQQTRREREAPPYRAPPPGPGPGPGALQHNRNIPLPLPLPPYRDPPPPTQSPSRATPPQTTAQSPTPPSSNKPRRGLLKDFPASPTMGEDDQPDAVTYNAQYRDLVRLITYQRDKLSSQQVELSKYDAEIVFWEGKTREQKHQQELIVQEAMRIEAQSRQTEEQLRALSHVEEESELVRQQEKTLKSEITLLRSKLANCETELLQCKNKIRLLAEETQCEERALLAEREGRHHLERSLLSEVERLQRQVDVAKQTSEQAAQCGEELRREVAALESAISDKKHQVEQLVSEMKEANLQSLAIAPADEIRHLLEGPHKPGSTRKMVGSPRQLENAVPTSKNPHGVWV